MLELSIRSEGGGLDSATPSSLCGGELGGPVCQGDVSSGPLPWTLMSPDEMLIAQVQT